MLESQCAELSLNEREISTVSTAFAVLLVERVSWELRFVVLGEAHESCDRNLGSSKSDPA